MPNPAATSAAYSLLPRPTFATAATAKSNAVFNDLRIGAICHRTFA